ncbi:hypothetical protein [Streptomyces sp. NPDC056160]|uniref:hypothetical protein n=1 Tax=Streptomyces sp. NPDC056160 TaxID=3345731 RepID=UPI0035E22A8C
MTDAARLRAKRPVSVPLACPYGRPPASPDLATVPIGAWQAAEDPAKTVAR